MNKKTFLLIQNLELVLLNKKDIINLSFFNLYFSVIFYKFKILKYFSNCLSKFALLNSQDLINYLF